MPYPDFSEYLHDVSEKGEMRAGDPLPLGARQRGDGVNFALFSRHATRVWLLLFDDPYDAEPTRAIELMPPHHRTGDVWHIWVQGVGPGQLYAYRVEGPYCPEEGHRFNPNRLLLDPFASAITCRPWRFDQALGYDPMSPQQDLSRAETDNTGAMPKCVFTQEHFHWAESPPPRRPWSETVIYETHVRGCTIHPSSGVAHPGTYHGLIEKIPYFKDLGITAVELMPVQEYNESQVLRADPETGEPLRNYWGYDPIAFTAPEGTYCSRGVKGHQKLEFKEMVSAFHEVGIEVIVDLVLNHTAEGDEHGPTFSFRGLDNTIYYMLDEHNPRYYEDYTGTGNTISASHPVVRDFILDVLRYWVTEMHVDGFRFDLASVLGRDRHGNLLSNPPLLETIAEDPILRGVKIIAEAWDAGGAYQVGSFSECRWAEWNGRFRDDVRRFWRGDEGTVGLFASRICGSADLYQPSGKGPESSVNFVTCHDGFTLNDLVSYRYKHNEANGEDNQDGEDENYSDNCGWEGETDDPEIGAIRQRQIKNFLLTLFISRGVPMLLGGDEFRRSQRGNNNAYCQDNEISWYDWSLPRRHQDIQRFARGMIAFRSAHPVLRKEAFYTEADICWFSPGGARPNWSDPEERRLACLILGDGEPGLYLMFNAGAEAAAFVLPAPSRAGSWRRAVDTSRPSPHDLLEPGQQVVLDSQIYQVSPRSSVILIAYP
jgi:isoamylase